MRHLQLRNALALPLVLNFLVLKLLTWNHFQADQGAKLVGCHLWPNTLYAAYLQSLSCGLEELEALQHQSCEILA